jgi:hypothetical protein
MLQSIPVRIVIRASRSQTTLYWMTPRCGLVALRNRADRTVSVLPGVRVARYGGPACGNSLAIQDHLRETPVGGVDRLPPGVADAIEDSG